MHNRHYNTRYERLQARRAIVIGQPRVSSNHFHTCECRACWSCTEPKCSAFHQKKQKCVQCIKREQELNSGEQQKLNFDPKVNYMYADYSDFMTFSEFLEMATEPIGISKEAIEVLIKQLATVGWIAPEDLIKDSVKQ
jgi:hypothetical protein